jgi:hypothetical protein
MTDNRCLMILTKDRRRFFTPEASYKHIVEFAKVFNAEVSLVTVQEGEVLDLPNLIPAICNASYRPAARPRFELVEVKIPQFARKLNDRETILRTAHRIREYITETLIAGDVVSVRELRERFKKEGLSLPALCNHVARVRREFARRGKKVQKLGPGRYSLRA